MAPPTNLAWLQVIYLLSQVNYTSYIRCFRTNIIGVFPIIAGKTPADYQVALPTNLAWLQVIYLLSPVNYTSYIRCFRTNIIGVFPDIAGKTPAKG